MQAACCTISCTHACLTSQTAPASCRAAAHFTIGRAFVCPTQPAAVMVVASHVARAVISWPPPWQCCWPWLLPQQLQSLPAALSCAAGSPAGAVRNRAIKHASGHFNKQVAVQDSEHASNSGQRCFIRCCKGSHIRTTRRMDVRSIHVLSDTHHAQHLGCCHCATQPIVNVGDCEARCGACKLSQ